MKPNPLFTLALAAGLLSAAGSAHAQLLHRYDFSVDGSDSVGTAHGSLVGTATIAGGALVTNGNNGGINGTWSGTGPRLTLDSSAVAGITGPFAIEQWVTATTGWPKFDTLFAFHDTTIDNYLLAAAVRGYDPWPSGVAMVGGGGLTRAQISPSWDLLVAGPYLDTNTLRQIVLTYDGNEFSYYVDGVLANHAGLPATVLDPGFNLSTLTSIGINGGSPYGDPSLTGSTSDFRIYGQALSPTQISSLFGLGADATNAGIAEIVPSAVPEPSTLTVGLLTAALLLRRRKA